VGYQTFHVGKSGNEFKAGIEAFDQNTVYDDHGAELRRGSSERHADAVIKFLNTSDHTRPFYIYLAPPVPHDPRVTALEFTKLYDPKQVPLPAAFLPLHPFDNGEMTVRDEKLAPWPRTPADTRQQLADYYACIRGLDFHAGRIFAALRENGEWTNTIVIFTGDNGLSLGEHGLFGKQNLYEFGGMHVPFVIAGPGIPKGKTEALVYLMDLFPTIADFAGAIVPDGVEGKNLRLVIDGKATRVRDVLYTAYRNCQRAVRDDRWKLVRYPLVNQTQLFDLRTDPHEMHNLAGQPAHAERIAGLAKLLETEMRAYGDPAPLQVANPGSAEWQAPAPHASEARPKRKGKQPK
jgi:arylsulfatase A-like enzyme